MSQKQNTITNIMIIYLTIFNFTPLQSETIYSNSFRCDGGENKKCQNDILQCDSGRACTVRCDAAEDDRRRLLQAETFSSRNLLWYCSSSNGGCCGATINCPPGYSCDIDCNYRCHGLTVNAQSASTVSITNCDYCDEMTINCPTNGRGPTDGRCTLEIEYNINQLTVNAEESFYDFTLTRSTSNCWNGGCDVTSSTLQCGVNGQHSCGLTNDASTCTNTNNICIDYRIPTTSPTNNPSITPTNNPSITPTNNPSITPTNNPSITPTNNPSVTPNISTINPSITPTITSSIPTLFYTTSNTSNTSVNATILAPTMNPTNVPTLLLSLTPTTSTTSTKTPSTEITLSTLSPTNSYQNLHFICHYIDNKQFILNFLSFRQYADLLLQMILKTIQIIGNQSINYNQAVFNPLTSWKKAGILNFVICNVFDTELITNNVDCPSYSDSKDSDDSQYIAVGVFEIVANHAINKYKHEIIDIMTSPAFKNKCTEFMNNAVNNSTQNRRRMLLEYNNFKIIAIEIVDWLNQTFVTTNDKFESSDDTSNTIVIISVVIVVLFVFINILGLIYYFKKKNKNLEGDGEIHREIEMNVNQQGEQNYLQEEAEGFIQNENIGGAELEDDKQNDNDETYMNKYIDDEIVSAVNETVKGMDDDIVAMVNTTVKWMNNDIKEADIINVLNKRHGFEHQSENHTDFL